MAKTSSYDLLSLALERARAVIQGKLPAKALEVVADSEDLEEESEEQSEEKGLQPRRRYTAPGIICQREGCKKKVPPGRRKYCSVDCSKILNRRSAAERSRQRAEAYRLDRIVKYAPRTCLGCGHSFLSEGVWNRLCGGCSERNSSYSYSRGSGVSVSQDEVKQRYEEEGKHDNVRLPKEKPTL